MTTKKYTDIEIFRRIISMARPYWAHLAGIFLLELLAVPIVLLFPIPVKIAVDSVLGSSPLPQYISAFLPLAIEQSKNSLIWVSGILQIIVVLLMQSQYMISYVLQTYTGEKLNLSLREKIFRHVQRLSFSFHDTKGTSDTIYRIQYDAPTIQNITIYGMIPFVSAVLKLIGMACVISIINVKLALVAMSISPVLFILARTYNKKMRPKYGDIKILESNVLGIIQEVMTSFRVVKAFGQEDREQERFVTNAGQALYKKVRLSWAEGIFSIFINITTALGTAAIIVIGVFNVQANVITLGELLMVLAYLSQLYGPLKEISNQTTKYQYYLTSAQRAFELLDVVPDVLEKPGAIHIKKVKGDVEYKNVSFSYDGQNKVLTDITFRVPVGKKVGIAGKTGAGKTTLVSLLPRFYDVSGGAVFIDGIDIRDYKLQDIRNQFAIVLQDPVLFSTTIRENILYANPKAHEDDIIKAAKAANAHDFIMSLPEKYDTRVGERGMRLSGGERQRISLARAFLKDAPILLLDEPTSSVDNKTEALIMDAMDRLMLNRTTFMIAHRLTTLEKCDIKIELAQGKIVSNITPST